MTNYDDRIKKLVEVFSSYYEKYDGKFDEEFLCGGFASKTNTGVTKGEVFGEYRFKESLQIKDWMKLIKLVAGTDYNFYDINLNHYGYTNPEEYEKNKERVKKEIGLFEL